MAKLDSADNILDDDDNRFFRNNLSRTRSIAGNGKHAGHAVLLTNTHATSQHIGQTRSHAAKRYTRLISIVTLATKPATWGVCILYQVALFIYTAQLINN